MALKEKILKESEIRKNTKNIYTNEQLRSKKQRELFLEICERVEEKIDCSEIPINSCKDVFTVLENNNLYIGDIVSKNDYEDFKKFIITSKNQYCPIIGKKPDKIYNFGKEEDRLEFSKTHEGIRF